MCTYVHIWYLKAIPIYVSSILLEPNKARDSCDKRFFILKTYVENTTGSKLNVF